jgi:hypothetical protein
MAAWQAGFHVVLPGVTLPTDYAERLGRVLPPGSHWDASSERWGIEDGDMIDVSIEEPAEVFARFDLRAWRPDLYDRFLAFVQAIGGRLRDAEQNIDVALTPEAFMDNLRHSRAARFVRDPHAYFEELRRNPASARAGEQ